jgi:hypothetical protein
LLAETGKSVPFPPRKAHCAASARAHALRTRQAGYYKKIYQMQANLLWIPRRASISFMQRLHPRRSCAVCFSGPWAKIRRQVYKASLRLSIRDRSGSSVERAKTKLDGIVNVRGSIAHRVQYSDPVRLATVKNYQGHVQADRQPAALHIVTYLVFGHFGYFPAAFARTPFHVIEIRSVIHAHVL